MNRTTMPDASPPSAHNPAAPDDPRARAFCSPEGPEIFYPVAHTNEIWRPDPFDVETIHGDAREVFRRLVARAALDPRPSSGRILLLKGESGSGKTHLMRAFRNWAHEGRRGYCGYMQMTSAADDYGRYILNNLIESLDQPYYGPHGEMTGLMRLSTALAESSRSIPVERLAQLREDELDARCLGRLVEALADQIVEDERFNDCDLDLIRALLYLQRDDARIKARVLKYLRCEDLSPSDRQALGDLTPRAYAGAADRVVTLLGRLMGSVEAVPLILCIDQLESIRDPGDAPTRFPRAMSKVCAIAEGVPSSVVVIACLEELYLELQGYLTTPVRFRIEHDPRPIPLSVRREPDEVVQLIARRLEALYEPHGVAIDEADPTYPIPGEELPKIAMLPTRLILDWCREFRDRCIAAGRIVGRTDAASEPASRPSPKPEAPDTTRLEQLWNDARTGSTAPVPTEDDRLARLLSWAIRACSDELDGGDHFAAEADDTRVAVERQAPDQAVERLLIGVCNKSAKGGALGRQVEEIERRTGPATPSVTPVIVRSTGFPTSPSAVVSKQIGKLVSRGGRRVVVEDADWRAMQAMRAFRERHKADPALPPWLAGEKPLSRLESLRRILDLDAVKARPAPPPEAPAPPPRPEITPTPGPAAAGVAPLAIGRTSGVSPSPVTMAPEEMIRHAAFLGAPGSGKTTVALSIVEQLLARGVPAILVDRKGDLCRYADPSAWSGPLGDAASEARRADLRARLDVAVYTPGNPSGRPLSIAPVPPGLGAMMSGERDKTALFAASALAGMLGYKASGPDQSRTVILARAMSVLGEARPDAPVSLGDLIEFIHDEDPALVNAIGKLDTRHFARLVQDLDTIRQSRGDLLAASGEPLDAGALLGLGAHARPGRARLSIISTKFLGAAPDVQFWVAQFLMEMARWSSRCPSKTLQATILFDEADLYLPAVGKPATKEPMENLLRRSRSAGLGLLLATQSPGDFDYRCRDNIRSWFVGRVAQPTALAKMKPMLSDCRVDVESRLPHQSPGQFHLIREGEVTALRADRSLVSTEQLPEDAILALARRTLAAPGPGVPDA